MVFNNNRNGFENELDMRNELNNKKVKELNIMYREFIEDLFINITGEDIITCCCDYRKKKYDIIIKKLNGKLYGINRFSKKCKRIYL